MGTNLDSLDTSIWILLRSVSQQLCFKAVSVEHGHPNKLTRVDYSIIVQGDESKTKTANETITT